MYPQGALNDLAAARQALRRRIADGRTHTAAAVGRVLFPLEWLDAAWSLWRELSPLVKLAAVPAGAMAARGFFPRLRWLLRLMRWAPLVATVLRAWPRPPARAGS